VRPLASPIAEYGTLGAVQIAGGIALGAVAAATGDGLVAAVELAAVGVFVAAWMYLLAYRRLARRAVGEPAAPPGRGGPKARDVGSRAACAH
jgi:hypothetical protein